MRVIAGIAKRIPLVAPFGQLTRPTSDMAKEGLFNILASTVPGASFLDLYAGSGAIGIEALSRGASHAAFVEKCPLAFDTIKTNLKKTRLGENASLYQNDSIDAIRFFCKSNAKFDIVFMDPPYSGVFLRPTLETLSRASILAPDGFVVVESDSKQIDNIPSSLYLTDTRKYGRAFFYFLKKVIS